VVFTTRRETQTTIEAYLTERGIKVGIINGTTGARNQDTLARFRNSPPHCHVIVSTEAGAEGINLQVANVLVNFDLPWNPMIVEQRIGRVQRLASDHASVAIFNIMLSGTFEEFIVGRLMEKLQMASHAVGDIESLLEATGMAEEEEGEGSFEEKVRILVLAALAGKDVEKAMRLAEESIENAKTELEREKEHIGELLGEMDGGGYVGPQAPKLPGVQRGMELQDFVLAAFESFGARISAQPSGGYLIEEGGGREHIRFIEDRGDEKRSVLYEAGTPAFSRLVRRVIASGVCVLEDGDEAAAGVTDELAREWVSQFGGRLIKASPGVVNRHFNGTALMRARANVAHDSYEHLVEVRCSPDEHHVSRGGDALATLSPVIQNAATVGVDAASVVRSAQHDPAVAEFCRFYLERREEELRAAGTDERKRKKLDDEFTPRLSMTLVGLEGVVHRQIELRVRYELDGANEYESELRITPSQRRIDRAPETEACEKTGRQVPRECLASCAVTGSVVLRHLLEPSDVSGRSALAEHMVRCALTGKRVLPDEAEASAVTGQLVTSSLLKTSGITGKRAEPEHFGRCDFTGIDALKSELATSEFSARPYRVDQQIISAVSGRKGHSQEFVTCYETRQPIALVEAERCAVTGHMVRPGLLEACSVTGNRVLPSELGTCAVTRRKALKRLLVTSNVSGRQLLEEAAIRSAAGAFCAPTEAKTCAWSGRHVHPDDIRVCELIGLPVHFDYVSEATPPRLKPLLELLNGKKRNAEEARLWATITSELSATLKGGRCEIDASMLAPDGQHLAVTADVRRLFGWRHQRAGLVYSLEQHAIVGRVALGKLKQSGWTPLVH
jgi:hypothetical protein